MKIGDLVRSRFKPHHLDEPCEEQIGIVIDVNLSDYQVPPVCKILWPTGEIQKEWEDDVEVVTK